MNRFKGGDVKKTVCFSQKTTPFPFILIAFSHPYQKPKAFFMIYIVCLLR